MSIAPIVIKKHAGIFTLEVQQVLPISLNEAWNFFSSPQNLALITPDHMGFEITSPPAEKMTLGQIITYSVSPFPKIKVNWVTEITHICAPHLFVDEQRFGPYKMWHHEHHFEETPNGILMLDKVSYKLPFGFIGNGFHPVLVKNKLLHIFSYRYEKLNEIFPTIKPNHKEVVEGT